MRRRQGDPLMSAVLDVLARNVPPRMPMAKLAGKVKTSTGYPGAYRTIGRLQAAGYVDVVEADVTRVSRSAAEVRLTRSGLLRYAIGADRLKVYAGGLVQVADVVTYNRATGEITRTTYGTETP